MAFYSLAKTLESGQGNDSDSLKTIQPLSQKKPFNHLITESLGRKGLYLRIKKTICINLWQFVGQICSNRAQPIPFGGGRQIDEHFFRPVITANSFPEKSYKVNKQTWNSCGHFFSLGILKNDTNC